MSTQWAKGFHEGAAEGYEAGNGSGKAIGQWEAANEMRVILCALITAHKREDGLAFWATVEIAKTTLGKYANFDDEDWALFRGDSKRKETSNPI